MNVPPTSSPSSEPVPDPVKPVEHATPAKKRWRFPSWKNSALLLVSVVSTIGLLVSHFEKIESFVRARMPGALARQFPFSMQISSINAVGSGLQERPFYREEHTQEGPLIRALRNEDFGLPALNFRIVNNSPETTIVREVILNVRNSRPDNRPILTWSKELNLAQDELSLENEGWGAALDSKLENITGILIPKSGERKTTDPFELVFGKIAVRSRQVPLASLLREQLRLENLSDFNRAKLSGTLSYSYIDSSGAKKPVKTHFALGIVNRPVDEEPSPPAEGPEPSVYQTVQLLQTHGQNYSVVCPVGQSLAPKNSYQFVIGLCSQHSAIHDFDVVVALTNGARIKLGHFRVEFYLPRSHARFVSAFTARPSPPRFTSIDGATEDIPGVGPADETGEDFDYQESETTANASTNLPTPPAEETPEAEVGESEEPTEPSSVQAESKPLKASYPYGIPVAGRTDVVESPFVSGKHVDVTGFAHNAIVQDPYVKQLFLVP